MTGPSNKEGYPRRFVGISPIEFVLHDEDIVWAWDGTVATIIVRAHLPGTTIPDEAIIWELDNPPQPGDVFEIPIDFYD